ncbi:MAG: hypothetical protein AAGE94_13355 [Acidobacteriota bacterium]
MDDRFAPVPVREHELLQEIRVGDLRVTEAWHKAGTTIASRDLAPSASGMIRVCRFCPS